VCCSVSCCLRCGFSCSVCCLSLAIAAVYSVRDVDRVRDVLSGTDVTSVGGGSGVCVPSSSSPVVTVPVAGSRGLYIEGTVECPLGTSTAIPRILVDTGAGVSLVSARFVD